MSLFGETPKKTRETRVLRWERLDSHCERGEKRLRSPSMRNQLDFEKPIVELQNKLEELKKHPEAHSMDISFDEEVALIEKKIEEERRRIYSTLSAWDRVKIARHPKRPFTLDYLKLAFEDFAE